MESIEEHDMSEDKICPRCGRDIQECENIGCEAEREEKEAELKYWAWKDGGHPMDVEDDVSAFTCSKCSILDRDESHWDEEGNHICNADW